MRISILLARRHPAGDQVGDKQHRQPGQGQEGCAAQQSGGGQIVQLVQTGQVQDIGPGQQDSGN